MTAGAGLRTSHRNRPVPRHTAAPRDGALEGDVTLAKRKPSASGCVTSSRTSVTTPRKGVTVTFQTLVKGRVSHGDVARRCRTLRMPKGRGCPVSHGALSPHGASDGFETGFPSVSPGSCQGFHALALRGARGKGCRLLSQKAVCPFPVTGFDTRPVVQGGGWTTVPGTPESGLWLPVLGRFNQHNAASVLSAPNVSHPGGQGCPSAVRVLAKGNAHFSWSESGPVCVLTHLGAGVASELGVRVLGSSVQAGNLSPLGAESGRPGLEGR